MGAIWAATKHLWLLRHTQWELSFCPLHYILVLRWTFGCCCNLKKNAGEDAASAIDEVCRVFCGVQHHKRLKKIVRCHSSTAAAEKGDITKQSSLPKQQNSCRRQRLITAVLANQHHHHRRSPHHSGDFRSLNSGGSGNYDRIVVRNGRAIIRECQNCH